MKLVSTTTLLVSLLAATSLHAKWSRIPVLKEKPVDIATAAPGSQASLDSSSGFGKVDSLLSDDITAPATVSGGKSFAIVNLGKPVLISQSSFVNDGIEGRATLSASADKQGWAVLEEKVFSAADRTVEFKFAGMQAKFIKLEFALSKGGMIRNLRFYGGQTDRGYAVKQDAEGKKGKPMDFLGGLGGGRIVYLAPKPVGGVDTAITYNKLAFPESDEKYRTVIYDLGQLRILNKFASVHSPRPVRFEVFAFDNLPEKEDWRGHMAFDPAEFSSKSPVAVAEDTSGSGELTATPSKPVKTRYLALRWEPEFNPPDFQASASGQGNVQSISTTTTTTTTDSNGNTVTKVVQVSDAVGAGAGSSAVTGDNAGQNAAQGQAAAGDTTTTTTTVTNPQGQTLSQTVETGNTTTTTNYNPSTGEVTSQSQTTENADGSTTTVNSTTNANGSTTTTTTTTDSNGNSTTTDGGTINNTGGSSGSGNGGTQGGGGTTGGTQGGDTSNLSGGVGSPAPNGGSGGAGGGTTTPPPTTPPVTSP